MVDGPLLSILPLRHPPVGICQESHFVSFVGLPEMINVMVQPPWFLSTVRYEGGERDRCRGQNGGKSVLELFALQFKFLNSNRLLTQLYAFE